jgi:hypothetical protein
MYSKIFFEEISRGESGLFHKPTVLGRLSVPLFILSVAAPCIIVVKKMDSRK